MKKTICVLLTLCMVFALTPFAAFADTVSTEKVLGVKDGNSYSNSHFGFQAELPDDWVILGDEEVSQLMGYVVENIAIGSFEELLESVGAVCDLMAGAQNSSGDSLNIQIEKLPYAAVTMSEKEIAENSASSLETALSSYATDIEIKPGVCSLAGKEHSSLDVTMKMGGIPCVERLVVVREGVYLATVTVFSTEESRLGEILGFFTAPQPKQFKLSDDLLSIISNLPPEAYLGEDAGK